MPRILVLEHDKTIAKDISSRLRARKHEVTIAKDAPLAMRLAKTTKPDLVLLDIRIPALETGMAGKIQDLADGHGIRFVFFDSGEGQLRGGPACPSNQVYDPEQLLQTVERVLAA